MNTDTMINALVADAKPVGLSLERRIVYGVIPAAILSAAVFYGVYGLRDDLVLAAMQVRFIFKLAFMLVLALILWRIIIAAARPTNLANAYPRVMIVAAMVMLLAMGLELFVTPQSLWQARLMGDDAVFCLLAIPSIALPILALVMMIMRRAAPGHAARAGFFAGFFAGSLGGAIYALHCLDDSPLFVGAWYGLSIAGLSLFGAALGHRYLRW